MKQYKTDRRFRKDAQIFNQSEIYFANERIKERGAHGSKGESKE